MALSCDALDQRNCNKTCPIGSLMGMTNHVFVGKMAVLLFDLPDQIRSTYIVPGSINTTPWKIHTRYCLTWETRISIVSIHLWSSDWRSSPLTYLSLFTFCHLREQSFYSLAPVQLLPPEGAVVWPICSCSTIATWEIQNTNTNTKMFI